jgi:glycosyltransferase involved in cell wall biosynthesis
VLTVFTPSFADADNTNAQNLTVKEIVSRLSSDEFRVIMCTEGEPDSRIAQRPNTHLIQFKSHGNTLRTLSCCLKENPEIYFFPREGPLDSGLFWLKRFLRLKVSVVSYIVTGGLDRGPLRPAMMRNILRADVIIGNSRHLSNVVAGRFGKSVGTIHDGIDRRYYFPNKRRRDESGSGLVILFAGSFRPYKRVDVVVRQARRHPEVTFRIAGQGEEEANCRNLCAELGCRNVEFLGHLSPPKLGDEMRRADIFFFPSILEGHPQVLGQAAACGLSSICMDVYHPDNVVNGRTGFLAADDNDLQEKLDLLIRRRDLREEMSLAAVAHAAAFEWDQITTQWECAFKSAIAHQWRVAG